MNYSTRLGIRHLLVIFLLTCVVGAGCDLFGTDSIEIDGVVSLENGTTVAGATVHLCSSTPVVGGFGQRRLDFLTQATTDDHGEFSISRIADDCSERIQYWLYVRVEDHGATMNTNCRSHSSVQLQLRALSSNYRLFGWCG